jgi:hypothetical protein
VRKGPLAEQQVRAERSNCSVSTQFGGGCAACSAIGSLRSYAARQGRRREGHRAAGPFAMWMPL